MPPRLSSILLRRNKGVQPRALAAGSQAQQGSRWRLRESRAKRLHESPAANVQAHGKARELQHDWAQYCERRLQHEAGEAAGGGDSALGGRSHGRLCERAISCRTSFRFVAHNQNCFRGVSFCAGVLALLRPISPRLQHPPQTAAASSAEQYCP